MIAYHVDRSGNLRAGQVIALVKPEYAEPESKFITDLFPSGISKAGEAYLGELSPLSDVCNPQSAPSGSFIDLLISSTDTTLQRFRELEFEYVRRLYFPHMPSRFQSFFGAKTIEEAKNWCGFFDKSRVQLYPIWKFKVCGPFSELDITWRDWRKHDLQGIPLYSMAVSHSFAFNYWNGVPHHEPRPELLIPLISSSVQLLERVL